MPCVCIYAYIYIEIVYIFISYSVSLENSDQVDFGTSSEKWGAVVEKPKTVELGDGQRL